MWRITPGSVLLKKPHMAKYAIQIYKVQKQAAFEPAYLSFETFLFNDLVHLLSQPCQEVYCFQLLSSRNRIDARFNLFVREGIGLSPCRAPFGAIEFNPSLDIRHLDFLLDSIEDFAASHGLLKLRMTGYPFSYAPEAAQTDPR